MDGASAFRDVACAECGATPAAPGFVTACPDCGGRLSPRYEFDGPIDPSALPATDDQYRFAPLLPFDRDRAVTMGEGGTPLVDCPGLADGVGVERLFVKDEGTNPTGSITDRSASLAVTAAAEGGAETVALPTTGYAGRSIAAYAGRAGLESAAFVPSRTPFDCKAMINVHGGEMTVAGGRYPDAVAAFEDASTDEWADVGPGSPFRQEGAVSLYGEVIADLGWEVPDAIVTPASHGISVVGLASAIDRFVAAGLVSERPSLVVAQPDGCAPIVEALREYRPLDAIQHPDTIAGALEVPDPVLGEAAVEAVRDRDGQGSSVPDDHALAAAVDANAEAGIEVGVAGGVALAAVDDVDLPADATVVVLNPTAGGTESDVLRSHLMGQGV